MLDIKTQELQKLTMDLKLTKDDIAIKKEENRKLREQLNE